MSEHHAAANAAGAAASRLGLPSPQHLRTGSRALFAAGDDVVLRVGGTVDAAAADRSWSLAMTAAGVRVPRPVADPVVVHDLCVVALERLRPVGPVDWTAVGRMVRRVHELDHGIPLPSCTGFDHWQFEPLLSDLPSIVDDDAANALRDSWARHRGWQQQVAASVPVTLHGDVHPGNVVQTAEGPVLLDWDLRCSGPAQWDHAPLMTWTERWGGEPGMYERFAAGYGESYRGDALAETLAELRLLAATLMRVAAWRRRPDAAAAELSVRLQWWRHRDGAPVWTPQ